MSNLKTNRYSINYDLEFINTKENALKALKITQNIWNLSMLFTLSSLFVLDSEKLTYPFNCNFLFCLILIILNSIILSKRYILIFYTNKMQRFNETQNEKLSIIVLIGLLVITTILGILHTMFQAANLDKQMILNIVIALFVIIGFVVKSKSIKDSIIKQILERNKKNKKEKLQKYHDSLLIINNAPILFSLAISFVIVTSNKLNDFEIISLYLFNFLILCLSKPQKQYFLQYCPKCFQIRSLGLSAYSYCPNCKRDEWNNVKENSNDKNKK